MPADQQPTLPPPKTRPRHHWLFWTGLVLYWPILFAATHLTPRQLVQNDLRGHDFFLHSSSFFLLTLFFWFACFGLERPNFRRRRVYVVFGILTLYAAIDEITQTFVQRTVSLDDWLANICGILTALFVLYAFRHALCWLALYWAVLCIVRYYPQLHVYVNIMPEHFARYSIMYLCCCFLLLTLLFINMVSPPGTFRLKPDNGIVTVVILCGYAVLDIFLRHWTGYEFIPSDLIGSLTGIALGLIAAAVMPYPPPPSR